MYTLGETNIFKRGNHVYTPSIQSMFTFPRPNVVLQSVAMLCWWPHPGQYGFFGFHQYQGGHCQGSRIPYHSLGLCSTNTCSAVLTHLTAKRTPFQHTLHSQHRPLYLPCACYIPRDGDGGGSSLRTKLYKGIDMTLTEQRETGGRWADFVMSKTVSLN